MFEFFRNKSSRVFMFVLVLLIGLSFVAVGLQDYSGFNSSDVVAKVANRKITQTEWDRKHQELVDSLRAQNPNIDAKLFDSPEFKKGALDELIKEYVLSAASADLRLSVPDARLQRVFANAPDFEQVRNPDGSLNTELLEAQGMSASVFTERIRQQLAINQVLGSVESTALASEASSQQALAAFLQSREAQWIKFEAKDFLKGLNPSNAQLQKFYALPNVASMFKQAERADVQFLVLDMATVKQNLTVNEAELRKHYQDNIKQYTQPEERRASHILIAADSSLPAAQRQEAKSKAQALLVQAKANPMQFGALAKQHSQDPGSAANNGDLNYFSRGAMVAPFENAVFALQKNQISEVVETDYGYHIILLTDIRGGTPQTFEQVQPQLEADVREQLAPQQFAEAAEQFSNMVFEQADSLQPAATALKLEVQSASQVLREPAEQVSGIWANQKLLDALFSAESLNKKHNTQAIEIGANQLVAARIVKHYSAAQPRFEQVQAQVREQWLAQESKRLAQLEAQTKMKLWTKDPALAQWPTPVSISRRTSQGQSEPKLLDAVMRVPESSLPALQVVDLSAQTYALVKINKVLPLAIDPQELKSARTGLASFVAKAEAQAYLKALQRQYKVDIKATK